MIEILDYLAKQAPVVAIVIAWAIRLETRLTRISTDIEWLKREVPKCQHTSADPTP